MGEKTDPVYDTARHVHVLYQNDDIEQMFYEWYRTWWFEPIYTITFNRLMAVRRFMEARAVLVYDRNNILQYSIIARTRFSRGQQEGGVTLAITIPSIYEQGITRYDKTAEGHPLNGIFPVPPFPEPAKHQKDRVVHAVGEVWSKFAMGLTTT